MARVSAPRLEELVREAEVLSTLKASVPHAWKILEHEIGLARLAAAADRPPAASPRQAVRKRVKLRVPAEQYPDYNFVGRLLGPRGATLKRLERDTGCRIMIRGKGSIRKDKEAEVRGKPGWEHVFHEPLHVVIEVVDAADEASASRILSRAKELVELLLVPVPEERDSLKRAQLRDLAILNGTHRSVADLLTPASLPIPPVPRPMSSPVASPPPPTRRASLGSLKPPSKTLYNNPGGSMDGFLAGFDNAGVSFARPRTPGPYTSTTPRASVQPASSPPPPPPPPHSSFASTSTAPVGSPPSQPVPHGGVAPSSFAPETSASEPYLPDLEKLRIPTLDFDHLNETNLTLHSYGLPAASPTIVDPEIYPYPPTPGLLNVDHQMQLNAFASPVWTPSRPMSSAGVAGGSSGLPPRSPTAPDVQSHSASSFLLGRPLSDPAALHQGSFPIGSSLREVKQDLAFEQGLASHVGGEDYAPAPAIERDHGTGGQSVLANLFPSSAPPVVSSSGQTQSRELEQGFELNQQQYKHHGQFLPPRHDGRQSPTSLPQRSHTEQPQDRNVLVRHAEESRSRVTTPRDNEASQERQLAHFQASRQDEAQKQVSLQRHAAQQAHRATQQEQLTDRGPNNTSESQLADNHHSRH